MLLLVEDDEMLGAALVDALSLHFDVTHARSIAQAEDALARLKPALILLDIALPDGSGLDLLRDMRGSGVTTPVILLTAQDKPTQRIAGLRQGADDFISKPFDLHELIARCEAVLRRSRGYAMLQQLGGGVRYDPASKQVTVEGQEISLSATELRLFDALVRRKGRIVSKGELEDQLYDWNGGIESNTIEVYISRLRRKIGKDCIRTVRGLGYALAAT
jgi:DNA-binding response OmpR family regulator